MDGIVMGYMFTTILVFAYLRETVFNMKSNLTIFSNYLYHF